MPPKKRKLADRGEVIDLYALLQVARGASHRQVVQAYHRQALLVHPDKGGNATSFQAVARAYEVLSDPISRDEYHMSLLELGRQDGLENVDDLFIGSKVHNMLADFPQDLIQVLLASPRRGWRQLLRDLRSEQLGRLLGALAELPHNCKKKQTRTSW